MTLFTDIAIWDDAKQRFPIGTMVDGNVFQVAPFGVFFDLGGEVVGLLRVTDMAGDNRKQITDYPQVGQSVTARVNGYDDRNRQVSLTQ